MKDEKNPTPVTHLVGDAGRHADYLEAMADVIMTGGEARKIESQAVMAKAAKFLRKIADDARSPSPQSDLRVTEPMIRAAIFSLYGDDFFDCFNENSDFAKEKIAGVKTALKAAIATTEGQP